MPDEKLLLCERRRMNTAACTLFYRMTFAVAGSLTLLACAPVPLASAPAPERDAIAAHLLEDITVLASDKFDGRKPGTDGETLTVNYIISEFTEAGVVPGTNDPGSVWKAPVALVGTRPKDSVITFMSGRRSVEIPRESAVAFSTSTQTLIEDADMVFVGFEAGRVKAEDIAGKVVVMLGEPDVSPRRRATLFEALPAAIITVVEDEDAIAETREAFSEERLILASEDNDRLTVFTTQAVMPQIVGSDRWLRLLGSADDENFAPVSLKAKASIEVETVRREFDSSNVIGRLPGNVPGSGAVLLLGHWDHLGECVDPDETDASDDFICNGAVDNASGIAVMLELARRLSTSGPFDRDIYFLATTAEEEGLFGARAFVQSPAIPLDTIVAAFNFDTMAIAPAGSPVGFVGQGESTIDSLVLEVLKDTGRVLGDKELAESFVQRQDGWALLQEDVPTALLTTSFGSEEFLTPYISTRYHQPADEVAGIELGGAVDDLLLHEELIRRAATVSLYASPETAEDGASGG